MEIKFTTGAGKIQTITIPDDMVFRGNLDLSDMGLTELPDLSAVTVTGHFICSSNQLTSLQGAPQKIGGDFICDDELLKQEYQKMILERESQDKKCSIKFKNAAAKLLVEKQQLSKPDSGHDI